MQKCQKQKKYYIVFSKLVMDIQREKEKKTRGQSVSRTRVSVVCLTVEVLGGVLRERKL